MFNGGSRGYVCPRCDKRVYFAEEIIAMGNHWHKTCFSCASCKKRLDSHNCTERNNEAYCTHCYAKRFGPKGYGFGQGAGVLSMDNGNIDEPVTSNISSYAQAQVASLLPNGTGGASIGSAGSRTSTPSSSSSPPLGHQSTTTSTNHHHQSRMNFGSAEVCRRCGKPVYLAERMIGAGSVWHKLTCFACAECNKKLQSTSLCDKDGDIFCKTCYGRKFGPKGYGYGIGAGTLQMQQ